MTYFLDLAAFKGATVAARKGEGIMTIEEKVIIITAKIEPEHLSRISKVSVDRLERLADSRMDPGDLTLREGESLAKVYDAVVYQSYTEKDGLAAAKELEPKLINALTDLSKEYETDDAGMSRVLKAIVYEAVSDDPFFSRLVSAYMR